MEFRRNILLTIIILSVFALQNTTAQVKAVNDKGEKIIVYPDGSWEYDREGEVGNEELITVKPKKKKPETKVEKEKVTYTREEMIAARNEMTERYRKTRLEKEAALQDIISISYELDGYVATKQVQKFAGTFPRNKAEEATYNARVNIMEREIKNAKKRAKAAKKKEKVYQKYLTYPGEKLMVAYVKMKSKEGNGTLASSDPKPKKTWNPIKILKKDKESLDPKEAAKQDYERQLAEIRKQNQVELEEQLLTSRARSQKLEQYLPKSDFKISAEPCQMAFDEVDPFTGKRKRATKKRELFSFIDEEYESTMKGKGYLDCHGFVSEVNGKDFRLVLDFTIQSAEAKNEFGGLRAGGHLSVVLIDGSSVELKNSTTDLGKVNPATSTTTFRGYYNLSKSALKGLSNVEVTKVRVVWGGGFEDYDVYELDFFRDQIRCLKQTK